MKNKLKKFLLFMLLVVAIIGLFTSALYMRVAEFLAFLSLMFFLLAYREGE